MSESGGVLVIGPAWVGDMVMAQSLFKTLKQNQPSQPIDVVAPEWSLPLLARMPEVRSGIRMPVGHGELRFLERFKLGRSLRERGYSSAIVLPGSLKSAVVPWAAKIKRRIGYRGEWRYGLLNDVRPLDRSLLIQTVQRYVALGCDREETLPPSIPFPSLQVDEANQQRLVAELELSLDRPVVALLPGAEYGPAKQWPIDHFSALARRLEKSGESCWIFGSQKEYQLGEFIARLSGPKVHNLCGKTRLVDVIDLLAKARVAVANDSGLMHVAAAADVPVIALYGSSSPTYTPPLSEKAEIVYLALECSPCFKRACPFGHTNCLNNIDSDQVYRRALSFIH